METRSIIPILRMFDEGKAKEFYLDFLGFQVDFEHRFEADFPLYMQISKGDVKLHLSEHHGDCTPGGAVRIEITEIERFHQELLAKSYKYARPGLEQAPWGAKEVRVGDPFGNHVTFYEWESKA
jgi:uncharacterized glyoxalase superfamily protein PhnB